MKKSDTNTSFSSLAVAVENVSLEQGRHMQGSEIIAHRGASFDAPENTTSSVKLAWQQGANAVEVDVCLSADGKIVAIHDSTPKRYGGPDRLVSEMSWAELQKLDVGAWKNKRYRGEKIPLLSELLSLTPANGRIFIEIKCGPEILPELKRVLNEEKLNERQTVIICLSENVIAQTRKQLPDLEAYWIASLKTEDGKKSPTIGHVIQTAIKLDTTAVDLGGDISQNDIQKILDAGLNCYIWTINEPARAHLLIQWGVAGITTNKPALMLEKGVGQSRVD